MAKGNIRFMAIALFSVIASTFKWNAKKYKAETPGAHFGSPIYIPRRKKHKGYIKDAMRDNRYNKFKKYR